MSLPVPPIFQQLGRLQRAYLQQVNAILGGIQDPIERASVAAEIERMFDPFAEEVTQITRASVRAVP